MTLKLQEKLWAASFGAKYLSRNPKSIFELNRLYRNQFGISREVMNCMFLKSVAGGDSILEVGCNVGCQLAVLKKQGYKNLYGIDVNPKTVQMAKKMIPDANILWGSAFDIPFKDHFFDLVFTSRVLIHIHPKDLKKGMAEINRVSKRYIWGFEYYHVKPKEVVYRQQKNLLWKKDFCSMYLRWFPKLRLVKKVYFKYKNDENVDSMFLLKKY